MKQVLMLVGALLLVTNSAALACACTAPDGSCSATTHCAGGCYAICGSGGCSSGCSGPRENSAPTISFSGKAVSPADLQQRLSDELGVQFVFAAKKIDDQFTVDIENASAEDLTAGLSKIGATAVLNRRGPEEKTDRPFARRFSLKAENVPTEAVSRVLAEIFGDSVSIRVADPNGTVSLDLENVTLADIRGELPRIAGIKLELPARK